MAYVSFDSLSSGGQSNQSNQNSVGFFSLKNDGDEAIVRFMHDDTASFEILGTHPITLNGKFRRCNCIRTPYEPIDKCPLCAKGENIEYRFFIHILQYSKAPDGSIIVEPKVWERSLSYANKLKEYINNYGPMSDVICKIVRHGKAGDMKTEYEIIPNLNKQVYRDDIFVKKTDCFNDFKALGGIVLDKSAEEISEYLNTGNFPSKNEEVANNDISSWADPNEKQINWSVDNKGVATEAVPDWTAPPLTQTAAPSRNWTVNQPQQVQRPTRF